MSEGITLELIKLFLLCIAIVFIWMWNLKKLYTRDYVTFMAAVFATPFFMQFLYSTIPIEWHNTSNDLLIMVMLYFILHIVGNTLRRAMRDLQRKPRHIL
jgi:hypothetical protein